MKNPPLSPQALVFSTRAHNLQQQVVGRLSLFLLFLVALFCFSLQTGGRITGGVAQRLVVALGERVGRPDRCVWCWRMVDVSDLPSRNGGSGEGDRRE